MAVEKSMRKCILSIALILCSSLTFADCPPANSLQHECYTKQVCNWQAPWYEGYTISNTNDDIAIQFIKAEWGRKEDVTKGPASSLCFYEGNKGGLIMLGQNSWGNVAMPKSDNWVWTTDDGSPVKKCTVNCHFDYPQ